MSSTYGNNSRPSGVYHTAQSSHSQAATNNGPRAKCDQVVFEALCKACEVIVGSRSTLGSTPATSTPTSTGSSRFNLQIPEIAGVRSILSQNRLQLHVPVRLDVFFQHADGSRELLERWCLEYQTASPERFLQVEGLVTTDPMVQLTHVCKRIVLWLRTLYCWSRLLPAAHAIASSSATAAAATGGGTAIATNPIGFSIYAHADYSDDISDLTQHQGFVHANSHQQQHNRGIGLVTTPYGELNWRVVHCAPSKLEQLLPRAAAASVPRGGLTARLIRGAAATASQPIPMKQSQQQHQQQQFAPRSAPVQQNNRPPTYTERSQQKRLEAQQQFQQLQTQQQQAVPTAATQTVPQPPARHRGMSYEPVRSIHRPTDGSHAQAYHQQQQQQHLQPPPHHPHHNHHPVSILRSNTMTGGESVSSSSSPHRRNTPIMPTGDNPPERVLSGLSLALLMASNDDDNPSLQHTTSPNRGDAKDDATRKLSNVGEEHVNDDAATVVAKARRAALHEMPPHLMEQQQQQHSHHTAVAAASGDYGYGYNNHIPWQTIHPSSSNPALVQPHLLPSNSFGRTLSTSPGSVTSLPVSPQHQAVASAMIAQTPPGAVFLGATPPIDHRSSNSTTAGGVGSGPLGHLIPPRNRSESKSITPPFQPRPAGFLHDPPTLYLESEQLQNQPQGSTLGELDAAAATSARSTSSRALAKAPVSSLDSLRSSPFQQQHVLSLHPESRSFMVSSLSYAPTLGSASHSGLNVNDSHLRGSLWGAAASSSSGGAAMLPSSLSAGSAGLQQQQHPLFQNEDYYSEEMPFAVELSSSLSAQGPGNNGSSQPKLGGGGAMAKTPSAASSSYLGNSSALATLAQKCAAPNQRLKLLERSTIEAARSVVALNGDDEHDGSGNDARTNGRNESSDLLSSLADQLDEFRAFGASLHVSAAASASAAAVDTASNAMEEQLHLSGTSSTSTPISLRT